MKNKEKDLQEIKKEALELMKQAGYEITSDVHVELDKELPYMGYTVERGDVPVVVVSGNALKSGAAVSLLIHELSHVYRFQTHHPSHDYHFLTSVTSFVMHGRAVEDYQEKILDAILNHLQDLYADDISFKIFNEVNPGQNISEFFLSWIHKPHKTPKTQQQIWENADALLGTAFAQANLQRHNIPDTGGVVAKAVKEFLSQVDKRMAEKFDFFKKFMILMPEEVTRQQFEKMLINYLSEFLKLTK